jgi:phasin
VAGDADVSICDICTVEAELQQDDPNNFLGRTKQIEVPVGINRRSNVMAEINPSAENVRVMLAETLGRLRSASSQYFELLEKGLGSSPLPIAGQAKEFCGYMQRNVTATFDLGDKLIHAKDVQDAFKIQSEFYQEQMRALTDQARGMGESAMKAATGVFTPKA